MATRSRSAKADHDGHTVVVGKSPKVPDEDRTTKLPEAATPEVQEYWQKRSEDRWSEHDFEPQTGESNLGKRVADAIEAPVPKLDLRTAGTQAVLDKAVTIPDFPIGRQADEAV